MSHINNDDNDLLNTINCNKTIKICLWGAWYGSKNIGDQTVLITITKLIIERISNSKIIVLSENAKSIERYMAKEGLIVEALDKWRQIHYTLRVLVTADLFIIGGGVPLYDKLSHALVCAFLVSIAKIFGCRVMTYAVATQSLKDPLCRFIYRNILTRLDLVTVRDPITFNELKNLGLQNEIILTADPGLTLKMTDQYRVKQILKQECIEVSQNRPLIGITTRKLSSFDSYRKEHYRQLSEKDINKFKESMAKIADFLTTFGQVVFIPMHTVDPDDDRIMAMEITSKMKNASEAKMISRQYSPTEIMGVISKCSIIIGTRVHSIILAAASNVPFITGAYDLKLFGIAESLNMKESIIDIIEMDYETIISRIKQSWEERDKTKHKLMQRVTELRKLVDLNADLAVKLCYKKPVNLENESMNC